MGQKIEPGQEGDLQKNTNAMRYFKQDKNIIRIPSDKIKKVYDLSSFSYRCENDEIRSFYDDDETGDGDTLVLQDGEEVKVSEVSDTCEIYTYFDGHNWETIYLTTDQYEEIELTEIDSTKYSTACLRGHFNLSYDYIEAVKFANDKYSIILSFRSCESDQVIFISKEEFDQILKCTCTEDVFEVLHEYDL